MTFDLTHDGLTVLKDFLDPPLIAEMKRLALQCIGKIPPEERWNVRSLGSIGRVEESPQLLALALDNSFIERIERVFGFTLRYHVGVIFSKFKDGPPTFWHQDYIAWSESRASEPQASHIQLLIYTTKTTERNGALRVLPGSHRQSHTLHDLWIKGVAQSDGDPVKFTQTLRKYENAPSWAYETVAGEVTVPVDAGDIIVIDTRLLHAAHANHSEEERPLLTLGFFNRFEQFSLRFRRGISQEVHRQRSESNGRIWDAAYHHLAIDSSHHETVPDIEDVPLCYRNPVPRLTEYLP